MSGWGWGGWCTVCAIRWRFKIFEYQGLRLEVFAFHSVALSYSDAPVAQKGGGGVVGWWGGGWVGRRVGWLVTDKMVGGWSAPHRTAPHRTALHCTAPHRTAPRRTAPHRTAPYRTVPHRTAPHRTAPHRAPHRAAPHRRTAPHRTPHRTAPHTAPHRTGGAWMYTSSLSDRRLQRNLFPCWLLIEASGLEN